MAAQKSIILITGANSGIGFELAFQLLSDASRHVLLGSRSLEKGEAAVQDLQARGLAGTVELLQVDVDSDESIAAAVKFVESKHGRLDALVNNAGIAPHSGPMSQRMASCFRTHATGPYLMVDAFAPLLKKSISIPRVINVSSGGGSITLRLDPNTPTYRFGVPAYRASKAALSMITACQMVDYEDFKFFLWCPGHTVSNLGPHSNAESGAQPTSAGAGPMVPMLNGERDELHGKFVHADGEYGW